MRVSSKYSRGEAKSFICHETLIKICIFYTKEAEGQREVSVWLQLDNQTAKANINNIMGSSLPPANKFL